MLRRFLCCCWPARPSYVHVADPDDQAKASVEHALVGIEPSFQVCAERVYCAPPAYKTATEPADLVVIGECAVYVDYRRTYRGCSYYLRGMPLAAMMQECLERWSPAHLGSVSWSTSWGGKYQCTIDDSYSAAEMLSFFRHSCRDPATGLICAPREISICLINDAESSDSEADSSDGD